MKTTPGMINFIKRVILIKNDEIDSLREEALELYLKIAKDSIVLYGDSRTSRVTREDFMIMQDLVMQRKKIPAIKVLRTLTVWGLIEAKNAIEDSRNFQQPTIQ